MFDTVFRKVPNSKTCLFSFQTFSTVSNRFKKKQQKYALNSHHYFCCSLIIWQLTAHSWQVTRVRNNKQKTAERLKFRLFTWHSFREHAIIAIWYVIKHMTTKCKAVLEYLIILCSWDQRSFISQFKQHNTLCNKLYCFNLSKRKRES